jgi:hypothetical protein
MLQNQQHTQQKKPENQQKTSLLAIKHTAKP